VFVAPFHIQMSNVMSLTIDPSDQSDVNQRYPDLSFNILKIEFVLQRLNFVCFPSQQKALFDNIRPLFNNKPLVVVANKCDVLSRSELSEEKEAIYKEIEKEIGAQILEMSTVTEQGVIEVKVRICFCFQFLFYRSEF
jgi:tRNA U34 5-carboxymethylaminomethyl modifying GTPase MnmE/TrmE